MGSDAATESRVTYGTSKETAVYWETSKNEEGLIQVDTVAFSSEVTPEEREEHLASLRLTNMGAPITVLPDLTPSQVKELQT